MGGGLESLKSTEIIGDRKDSAWDLTLAMYYVLNEEIKIPICVMENAPEVRMAMMMWLEPVSLWAVSICNHRLWSLPWLNSYLPMLRRKAHFLQEAFSGFYIPHIFFPFLTTS